MDHENTVLEVHKDLMALHDEATRARENPIVLRLIANLLRLTSIDGSTPSEQTQEPTGTEPEDEPTATGCTHAVRNIYGRCQQCGDCSHPVLTDGVCVTCNETVSA